jgi:NAD(P)-dependent dehydrogenase (short-subunit alcohol dehydrogenase family)
MTSDIKTTSKRFNGKVAIVTGGGTGIGLAVAKAFVAEGGQVVILGRREAILIEAAQLIDATGKSVATLAGDISKIETAGKAVLLATAKFGGVDVLFNNAGIFNPTPFLDHTEVDFDRYVSIILKGKFFMAQAATRAMQNRGGGAIVQTGSMWAERAVAATPSSAYSAANAGVHAMVRNLAVELASLNIRINAVAPAVVETPVYGTFMSAEQVKEVLPTFNSFHPLGRIGQPQDIVGAMLFLASAEASWITGTVLPVDGGVMASR